MYAITVCFDSSILQVMDLIFSAKELFPVPSIAKKVNAQLKKFVVVVFFSSQFTPTCHLFVHHYPYQLYRCYIFFDKIYVAPIHVGSIVPSCRSIDHQWKEQKNGDKYSCSHVTCWAWNFARSRLYRDDKHSNIFLIFLLLDLEMSRPFIGHSMVSLLMFLSLELFCFITLMLCYP